MRDDIEGNDGILLQPSTVKLPVTFEFAICSSFSSKDGNIPYGHTLFSVTAKVYDSSGNEITDILVSATATITSGIYATVQLTYPTSSPVGEYKLTLVYTTSGGYVDEADVDRILVKDK